MQKEKKSLLKTLSLFFTFEQKSDKLEVSTGDFSLQTKNTL